MTDHTLALKVAIQFRHHYTYSLLPAKANLIAKSDVNRAELYSPSTGGKSAKNHMATPGTA